MRLRFGLLVGAAIGYYLGTRDGRQRYEQINKSLARLQQNPRVAEATDKAKTLLDQQVDKAKHAVDQQGGVGGLAEKAVDTMKTKVGQVADKAGDTTETATDTPTTSPTDSRDTRNSAHRDDEPMPYTAPDYDPDGSGRTPADKPKDLPGTAGGPIPAASGTVGDGSERRREPQPYVDPSHDPAKGSTDGAAGFGNTDANKAKPNKT